MKISTAIQQSLNNQTFIKITLSLPAANADDLKNVYIRKVMIKNAEHLSFTYRYARKDIVKNYLPEESILKIEKYLTYTFSMATLFTTEGDYITKKDKNGDYQLQKNKKPSLTEALPTEHNQAKQYLIAENAAFLQPLGIANKEGKVLAAHYDKFKQINKYVEIVAGLLRGKDLPSPFVIADMGCGKGYLTFALYAFLKAQYPDLELQIEGVELRKELVEKCNNIAKSLNYNGLQFVENSIEKYPARPLAMLIALHACDTATDLAIAKGLECQAPWIITAPCCHRQIRKEMQVPSDLQPILKHGILEERQAEILTDGIRALLLEANQYKTAVFEFISNEHTAKNLMITAVRSEVETPKEEILQRIQTLKTQFGIGKHFLETLL